MHMPICRRSGTPCLCGVGHKVTQLSNANILWGGAATALLGATLAEWQRKRAEEEAARLAACETVAAGMKEEMAAAGRMRDARRTKP